MFSLITLFAREVPTQNENGRKDVEIFKDQGCTDLYVRIPWWHSSRPTKRSSRITLNCYKWNLTWA